MLKNETKMGAEPTPGNISYLALQYAKGRNLFRVSGQPKMLPPLERRPVDFGPK
jgi:hypothetical protein